MVKDHENVDEIGADLSVMLYVVAGFCTALLFSVVFGKTNDLYCRFISVSLYVQNNEL